MSDFAALTLEAACDRLIEQKPTLILFHVRPDGDAVGSAFALRALLEAVGMPAWCVCADEMPERLAFLAAGTQESVLPEAIPDDFCAERIVSVDTASPAQMGALFATYEGCVDLMIDHHGMGEPYADHLILPTASSCGEIVFALSRELLDRGRIKEIPLSADIGIYAAISSDTGCFKYANVTENTHFCGAELVRRVDTAAINQKLYGSKPYVLMRAEKAGFDRLRFYHDRKIAVISFPYELKCALGLADEHLDTLVDVARVIEGVEVAVAIKQKTEEKSYRISTRASGDVDLSVVCAAFGGGGHVRASGCTIDCESIEEAERRIVNEIEKQMK